MSEAVWHVHKFGGTSLANVERFRQVASILEQYPSSRQAVVVSAVAGVTDDLFGLVSMAQDRDPALPENLEEIGDTHRTMAAELLDGDTLREYSGMLDRDLRDLADILRAAALLRAADQGIRDVVSGYGELWSAQLLAGHLAQLEDTAPVNWLDARNILTVESHELGPVVNWELSYQNLHRALPADYRGIVVVTGYIASDRRGVQTTLGRNGSDFSASIFGALLDAEQITIWTDVEGVMSGDPRRIPDAAIIKSLSYNEAMELAYFGAKVIHPQTMAPAVAKQIPIVIRSTLAPDKAGSRITVAAESNGQIKGITSIDGIALVNLEGAGMIGVPGTADRLFHALREAGISVVLISQASSEHSICLGVPEEAGELARMVIRKAFDTEMRDGQIQNVDVTGGHSILAVVGDGMAGMPGVAAKVFGSLGEAGVNVRAIAQGSSERNISAVIDSSDSTRALRAVHAGFYLSPQTLSIGLIGPGNVGGSLLGQIAGEQRRLLEENNVDLRVRGILSGRRMLLDDRSIQLDGWRGTFEGQPEGSDLERFVDHVQAEHLPHAVIIDCTASEQIAAHYEDWLRQGVHVITPNKKANSGPYEYYHRLRQAARRSKSHYLYETNVGAGLPIIHTTRDLIQTGDRITSVQGIFSGTMAYLFNLFDGQRPFSSIVREARERGYTEPDPRDDLSGMDVARKLIILAREGGMPVELDQLVIENLVPEPLRDVSVEEFLDRLPEFDADMHALLNDAHENGEVLRYVGRLEEDGHAAVGLERFPREHAFGGIALTDNVVQFITRRYCDNPLIVRGPGAGPDVTAAGIFADLLRLTAYLGAKL